MRSKISKDSRYLPHMADSAEYAFMLRTHMLLGATVETRCFLFPMSLRVAAP